MNSLKVLIEGYARENKDGSWNASSSTILLESSGVKVLVDPGANIDLLKERMKEENLSVDDIDILFLTHYHPDHIINIRLFPDHKIYDGDTIYTSDLEEFFEEKIPGTDIGVIETPGHAHEEVSLVVDIDGEIFVVAQDVFWWVDGAQKSESVKDLINLEDPFAKDMEELKKSRKKVLDIADWIVPGHGVMFKNPTK